MKKIIISLCLITCLFGCSATKQSGFVDSTVKEVIDQITDNDDLLILINNEDCYSCEMFKEDTESLFKDNNLTVYELNASDLSDEDKDQLNIALGTYSTWPTLFYVKNGSVVNGGCYEYSLDPEGYKTWLQNMNLIQK